MRALLDTCLLYPPVLREILLAAADAGLFQPLWSARILTEWQRRADKDGPENGLLVAGEIVRLSARWPVAAVNGYEPLEPQLWLPDPADIHVLAAAIAGRAEVIVTMNLGDFPRRELDTAGLRAIHPDAFLFGLWQKRPEAAETAVAGVLAEAAMLADAKIDARALLKRARLPRLAKALVRT